MRRGALLPVVVSLALLPVDMPLVTLAISPPSAPSVDLDVLNSGSAANVLDILVPPDRRAGDGVDQRIDREVEVSVTLPGKGRVMLKVREVSGMVDTIPVFDSGSAFLGARTYASWFGLSDAGDMVRVVLSLEQGTWETLSARVVMADEGAFFWDQAPGERTLTQQGVADNEDSDDPHALERTAHLDSAGGAPATMGLISTK